MTTRHTTIAIDPGQQGGAAMCAGDDVLLARLGRDTPKILGWLQHCRPVCWIEDQAPRPGNTPASAFAHGREFGRVLGWAEALHLPVRVLPIEWPALYVDGRWSKQRSVNLATALYPGLTFHGPNGGLLHGLSDAALMLNLALQCGDQ